MAINDDGGGGGGGGEEREMCDDYDPKLCNHILIKLRLKSQSYHSNFLLLAHFTPPPHHAIVPTS